MTAYPQVEPLLQPLLSGIQAVLQRRLTGIYVYGSLVSGDFDPAVSDIDLAVVMRQPLTDADFGALHRLHERVAAAFPAWEDRLELAYLPQSTLDSFRTRHTRIGIISPGEPFHQVMAGRDWVISWHLLWEVGVALYGPPIKTLCAPISRAEYLQALREHILLYRTAAAGAESKAALSYIVLTTARGLHTLLRGAPSSKIQSAGWAKATYPQWTALIDRALLWRRGAQPDALTADDIRPQVQAFVQHLLAQLPD